MAKQERTSKADRSTDLSKIRHSASHILAEAVLSLYPDTKLAFGPATDDGFYYDFEFSSPLLEQDLEKLEAEMEKILKEGRTFEPSAKSAAEAKKWAKAQKQTYKEEQIGELADRGEKELSFYQSGPFIDLCAGPHVHDTSAIGAVKLMSLAGAYWKGSEKNKMLTRIYGTAFATKDELDNYLAMLEEAKKRDHRKIGRELGLFHLSDDIGPGLPLFPPKGEMLRYLMESYVREVQTKYGYQHVWTGHVVKEDLYKKSGHYDNYKDSMFPAMVEEDTVFRLKPMNCPSHMTLYKEMGLHSYKELPMRFSEFATLYRYEKSGELNGLTRVRALTQDDCHVFCREDQIQDEFALALNLIREVLATYKFTDYKVRLSLRGNEGKFVADDEKWELATNALRNALDANGVEYEAVEGEAAFYGPKADFMARDVLGREWQLSTIQVDFIQPARLGCEYIGEDGVAHTPVLLHRAVTGTTERFMGVIIEHFGGAFPTWLSPIQAQVLPISDKHLEYGNKIVSDLRAEGIRVEMDTSGNSIGKKIREAELQKTPYMLIIGDKEVEAGTVAVRSREKDDMGPVKVDKFIKLIQDEVKRRV